MTRSELTKIAAAALAAAASVGAAAASAATIYDNLGPASLVADCSFSTTCAASVGRGDEFAAQAFTLGTSVTIASGAFIELDLGATPTSVKYAFYAETGGLPGGAALGSGTSALTASPHGVITAGGSYNVTLESFAISPLTLGPGNYFVAIQAVSPVFETYLEQGLVTSGAAETHDGGATWSAGYETAGFGTSLGGISVALYDAASAVPEPAAWTMMLVGFGCVGGVVRRRKAFAVV